MPRLNRDVRWLLLVLVLLLGLINFHVSVQAKQMNGPMLAAWSPDGTRILTIIAQTEESWSLSVLDVSTDKLTKIADDAVAAAWSPDGKQIVYRGQDAGNLVTINADGSAPKKVASNGYSLTWSPDGKTIRFLWNDSIATVTIKNSQIQRVTQQKGQNFVYYEWSPDQKQIAFTSFTDTGLSTVYLMNADGTQLRKVASSSRGGDIAWSPDGKHLATSTSCGESEGVCIWQPDGTAPKLIVKYGENQQWSPDGKQLSYVLGGKICVVNADSSDQHCLTKDATGSHPLWSPDGKQLIFIATIIDTKDNNMTMTTKLNMLNADGTGFKQLVP